MQLMFGVWVTGSTGSLALVDAADPGSVLDQSQLDLSVDAIETLRSTIVETDRMLAREGHRLIATRITWNDTRRAVELRDILLANGVTDVSLVSTSDAATAWVRRLAAESGIQTSALLLVEDGTVALSVVSRDAAGTGVIAVEPFADTGPVETAGNLLQRFRDQSGGAQTVYVVNTPGAATPLMGQLIANSPLPVHTVDNPAAALARGAASAPGDSGRSVPSLPDDAGRNAPSVSDDPNRAASLTDDQSRNAPSMPDDQTRSAASLADSQNRSAPSDFDDQTKSAASLYDDQTRSAASLYDDKSAAYSDNSAPYDTRSAPGTGMATAMGPQMGDHLAYSLAEDNDPNGPEYADQFHSGQYSGDPDYDPRYHSAPPPDSPEYDDSTGWSSPVPAPAHPRMLLVGSTAAAMVIVSFAVLAVVVAIGIQPAASEQAIRDYETVPGKYLPVMPGQSVDQPATDSAAYMPPVVPVAATRSDVSVPVINSIPSNSGNTSVSTPAGATPGVIPQGGAPTGITTDTGIQTFPTQWTGNGFRLSDYLPPGLTLDMGSLFDTSGQCNSLTCFYVATGCWPWEGSCLADRWPCPPGSNQCGTIINEPIEPVEPDNDVCWPWDLNCLTEDENQMFSTTSSDQQSSSSESSNSGTSPPSTEGVTSSEGETSSEGQTSSEGTSTESSSGSGTSETTTSDSSTPGSSTTETSPSEGTSTNPSETSTSPSGTSTSPSATTTTRSPTTSNPSATSSAPDVPEPDTSVTSTQPRITSAAPEPEPEPVQPSPTQQYTPTQEAPAYTPTQEAPAYTPTQEAPAYTPTQEAPAYTPTQEAPAYTPTQEAPAYTPTVEIPTSTISGLG